MKKQVILIHGGETFDTYEEYFEYLKAAEFDPGRLEEKRWKDTFAEDLGDEFQVTAPEMPCKYNAKYSEWKIWLEKVTPFAEGDIILVGHSLGALFLAKYLAEEDFPKKILATYLIAAPFDTENADYSLGDFILPTTLEKFEKQGGKIFLYQSEDDPLVSLSDFEKYQAALPTAEAVTFKDRGHFSQKKLPELIESIRALG